MECELPPGVVEVFVECSTAGETSKTEFDTLSEHVDVVKGYCWVCSSPLLMVLNDDDDELVGFSVFEELCTSLNFTYMTTLVQNAEIENTEFCERCTRSVRTCKNIRQHVKRLQKKLKEIQNELKKNIEASFRSIGNEINSNDGQEVKFVAKKSMVQCWSDCRVDVVQLSNPVNVADLKRRVDAAEIPRRGRGRPPKKPKLDRTLKAESEDNVPLKKVAEESDTCETIILNDMCSLDSNDTAMDNHTAEISNIELIATNTKDECEQGIEEAEVVQEVETFEGSKGSKTTTLMEQLDNSNISRLEETDRSKLKLRRTCDKCGKWYRTHAFFKAHLKSHPEGEELQFPCDHCERKFYSKSKLNSHVRNTHPDVKGTTESSRKAKILSNCPHCGLKFVGPEAEAVSENDSQGKNAFGTARRTRKRVYETEKQKRNHIRGCKENPSQKLRQLKETRVPCDQCEKSFVTASALRSHVDSIHNKSFKFCCDICGMGFQVSSMLQRHVQFVHSTEKKFECDTCNAKFRRAHQLFYHQRKHTGELPFICEFCGKGFHVQEKLRLHVITHSDNKTVPCPLCGKLFLCKQYVANHISTFHNKSRKGRIYNRNRKSKKQPEATSATESALTTTTPASRKINFSKTSKDKLQHSPAPELEKVTEVLELIVETGVRESRAERPTSPLGDLAKGSNGVSEHDVIIEGSSIELEDKDSTSDITNGVVQGKPPEYIFDDSNNFVLEYIVH